MADHAAHAEQARIDRLWVRYWREFANYYVEHRGAYVCVPGYDRSLPSSTGQSIKAYRAESQWQQPYTDDRGREQTRALTKPEAEAYAAVALLPKVEVGQYGHIHSGSIAQIVDHSTLVLQDVWLVDAEAVLEEKDALQAYVRTGLEEDIQEAIRTRTRGDGRRGELRRGGAIRESRADQWESIDWAFEDREEAIGRQRARAFGRIAWMVIGYRTDKLVEDARWPSGKAAGLGLKLVVVAVEGDRVTAVPAAVLDKGLNELGFLKMLDQRGLTKQAFVDAVGQAKREVRDRGAYVARVLARLEGQAIERDGPSNDAVELAE